MSAADHKKSARSESAPLIDGRAELSPTDGSVALADALRPPRSHGTGRFTAAELGAFGEGTVIEDGVLIFHPERVHLGACVYVGHQTILKGYYQNEMRIGDGVWIGQQCFFHSAGGITIGRRVGIGPGVRVLSSTHDEPGRDRPIMAGALRFAPVRIGDGADLGMSTTVLPGVTIGAGAQIGAGAVVARDIPPFAVAAGVPARVLRMR